MARQEKRKAKIPDARLIAAVREHDLKGVQLALADGADPNALIDERWPVLSQAAKLGGPKSDVPIARLLLQHGADPDGTGVILFCRVELLAELLAAGAHVDGESRRGEPLFWAITARSKQDKALALIDAGARFDLVDSTGETPLITAARRGRAKVVQRLLSLGADTTCVDHDGRSALRHAVEGLAASIDSDKPAYRTIIKDLSNRSPAQPEDLAIAAVSMEDLRALGGMLDRGLAVDVRIPGLIGGIGATTEAILKQAGGFFEALSGGINPTSLDSRSGGTTLLMWAVALEKVAVVELLLARGADANLRTGFGISACDISIFKRNMAVQRLMGTAGISWFKYKPGKTFAPPPPVVDHERRTVATRVQRLQAEMRPMEPLLEGSSRRSVANPALAPERDWERLSVGHVREDLKHRGEAAERMVATGVAHFGEPDSGVPERWMATFSCALAAASLRRDEAALERLANWVKSDHPRGRRSPEYNEHYFRWPLYQIWCASLARRRIDPMWRAMILDETARAPKLLLNATDAIVQRDVKTCVGALRKLVTLHKKSATHSGVVLAERVLQSDVCFVASEARRAGVLSELEVALGDWVLAEL